MQNEKKSVRFQKKMIVNQVELWTFFAASPDPRHQQQPLQHTTAGSRVALKTRGRAAWTQNPKKNVQRLLGIQPSSYVANISLIVFVISPTHSSLSLSPPTLPRFV